MLPVLLDSQGVLVCIRGIRALLLFLASFLQEPALLHGWIEHALLPPDYTDLSGVFINSSVVAAARVCIILQMKNVLHSSHGHTDLSKQRRRGREKRQEEGICCHDTDNFVTHQTSLSIYKCLSLSISLDSLCLLKNGTGTLTKSNYNA